MNGVDMFLTQYGLAAAFLILLIKTIGVPLPIPGDLLILAAAVRVAQGELVGWQAFLALLLALLLGGVIQFGLARGPGRALLLRFGRYIGLTQMRIDAAAAKMQKGGIPALTISILIPGIRGVAIVASGLAHVAFPRFLLGLTLGNLLFLSLHFVLGYLGGSALTAIGKYLPSPPVLVVVIVLLIAVYVLWVIAARRQKAARAELEAIQHIADQNAASEKSPFPAEDFGFKIRPPG